MYRSELHPRRGDRFLPPPAGPGPIQRELCSVRFVPGAMTGERERVYSFDELKKMQTKIMLQPGDVIEVGDKLL